MNRFRTVGLSLGMAAALLTAMPPPVPAAVPANLRFNILLTPSHTINTRYRDGNDGTASIPLGWGSCSDITGKESGGGFSTNIATYCGLIEPSAGAATVTASTLGTGWTMTGTGNRTLTLGTGVSSTTVTFTATYSGKTATKTIVVASVAAASTDSTAPTIPLSLTAAADTTGIQLTWDPAMDPHVSGQNETGLKDYQIFRDGSGTALTTVNAASLGTSVQFTGSELGGSSGGSTTQSANTYTVVTTGGIGTTDTGQIACAPVSGDFVLSAQVYSLSGGDATNAAGAIIVRDSTTLTAGQLFYYSRLTAANNVRTRVRTTASTASSAVGNSLTQAAPGYLRIQRVGNTFSSAVSGDGNVFSQIDSRTFVVGTTVPACLYGSNGGTGTTTLSLRNAAVTQAAALTYHDAITDGASHSYTIKARDNVGTPNVSTASAAVSATAPLVTDTTAPSAPTGNACTGTSSTTISCSWTACTDASGIRSYVPSTSTTQTGSYTDQAEQTATTFGISGLSASTTRWVKEKCIDNAGIASAFNTAVSGTTLSAPPADTTAPTVPTANAAGAKAGSTTVLTISSSGSTDTQSGILDYRLYYSTAIGGPFTAFQTCATFPCDFNVGSSNTTRYFQLSARDGAATPNESARSATFSGTTSLSTTYTANSGFEYSAITPAACGNISDFVWTAPDASQWQTQTAGGTNTCVSISTDHALDGTRSIKSVITRDSAADFRAELYPVYPAPTCSGAHANGSCFNIDHWYGMAVYIPAGYVSSAGRDIVFQWHTFNWLEPSGEGPNTSPLNSIQITNNRWQIQRQWNTAQPSTLSTRNVITTTLSDIVTGSWQKWVCRIKWHWINGETQCWLNGVEVYNVNGGNMSNDIYAPYGPLIGNYRVAFKTDAGEAGVNPRILYVDKLKVVLFGGSYAAVAP